MKPEVKENSDNRHQLRHFFELDKVEETIITVRNDFREDALKKELSTRNFGSCKRFVEGRFPRETLHLQPEVKLI